MFILSIHYPYKKKLFDKEWNNDQTGLLTETLATTWSRSPTGCCCTEENWLDWGWMGYLLVPISRLTIVAPKVTPTKIPMNCPKVFFQPIFNYYKFD